MASAVTAGEGSGDPTRSARTAQRHLRILEVASQCFARGGFARTRIDDVAAAAGVSRALVYHYFGSKQALARAVQNHMLAEWSAAVDRSLAESDGVIEALGAWIRVNLADTRRRPLLLAILAEEAAPVLVGWEDGARHALAEWRAKLIALLERGIATGELRADLEPESAAEVLRAMQIGMMEHLLLSEPFIDVSDERHLRAATEILVGGLRAAR